MVSDPERAKLDALAERIRQAGAAASPPDRDRDETARFGHVGFELAGAVLGSVAMGVVVDKAFPALAPWPLIVMILLGFIVGTMRVLRALAGSEPEK